MAEVSKVVFKSFDKEFREMFTADNSDIEFVLFENNETKRIRAHERYLSVVSIIFDNMFAQNWQPSSTLIIKINDVDYDSFNAFIQYLYGEEITIDRKNIISLNYLGKKYNIDDMVASCEKYENDKLSTEGDLDQRYASLFTELVGIRATCVDIIDMTTLASI